MAMPEHDAVDTVGADIAVAIRRRAPARLAVALDKHRLTVATQMVMRRAATDLGYVGVADIAVAAIDPDDGAAVGCWQGAWHQMP